MKPIVFEYQLKGQVDKELNKVTLALRGVGDESYNSFNRMRGGSDQAYNSVKKLTGLFGVAFSAKQALNFAQTVGDVRGEIQQTEVALGVLLNSEEKQKRMLAEITAMSLKSPFTVKEYGDAAQLLLGFNVEGEKTIPILRAIGDISMGNRDRFNSLNLAFAQMYSTGKLMGQDLLQMINAGFNPLSVIAEKTGKSIAKLKKEMEGGAISSKMVEEAFMSAASAGGKYYNMLEKQSKGIIGGKSDLRGAVQEVLNDLGKANEELIAGSYKTAASMVRNYDTIGKALLGLVSVYGSYKVAVALVSAASARHTAVEVLRIRALVAARKAQHLLNASMLTNPYVLAAMAITGLVAALVLYNKNAKSTSDIIASLKQATDNYDNSLRTLTDDISRYDALQEKAKTSTGLSQTEHTELNTIMERMLQTVPNLGAEFDKYGNILNINIEAVKGFADAQKDAYKDVLQNDIDIAAERKKQLEKSLEVQRKIFQDGIITRTQYVQMSSMGGMTANTYTGEANQKEKNKAREEWKKTSAELLELNTQIATSTNTLNGIVAASSDDNGSVAAIIKNKAHWEAVKKGAEEAIAAMDEAGKGTEEWIKQQNLYNEATQKLKAYDLTDKTRNKTENEEQKKLDASMKLLEKNKQLSYERLQAENDMEQKKIDLLNDSFAKRQRQNDLNYKKEIEAADKHAADMLKVLQEAERLEWEKNGSKGVFKATTATLPADMLEQIAAMKQAAKDAYDHAGSDIAKDVGQMWQEERIRFADELTKQLADIDNYYKERIKQAEGNEALIAELTKNKQLDVEKATAEHAVNIVRFESEMTLRQMELKNEFYLFESARRKKYLEEQKRAAEQELEILEDTYAKIPTVELEQQIRELKARLAEFNKELDEMPVTRFREVLSAVKSVASALAGLGGEIGEVFSAVVDQIDNIEVAFDSTASATDRVSAGLSGIVSVISMITGAAAKRKAAEKEFYKNSIAFAHEYALALNEQLRLQSELSGSSFVTDYAGKIKDGYTALTDATRGYQEAMSKLSEGKAKIDLRNSIDWGSVGKGAAGGAAAGAAIGSVVPVIGTAIGAVVGAVGGFFAGLFGGKKKKNQYGGLLDVFPELVDGAGNLNRELAQTLINTEQVDDNTKQLIQNALDWADAIEVAQEQIREVVVDLAGDLGNNLRSAIVDAWKAGEDASVAMFDKASESLEKFVEQLLYSTIFGDVFKEFENDLVASLHPDTGDGDVVDDFERFMSKMDARDDTYIALLDAVKKRAKENGFNLWENDADEESTPLKGSTNTIKAVSQDSFNEGLGRITALVIYSADANKSLTGISNQMADAVQKLQLIVEYTAHCKRLEAIERDMKATKQSLSNIELKGITIKK